jgi:hypothetical protein
MPVFRSRTAFELVDNVTAFFNLELGLTRGQVPASHIEQRKIFTPAKGTESDAAAENSRSQRHDGQDDRTGGVNPANIIWIFGTARTGSTWLANMMEEIENHKLWDEPLVGALFGNFHYVRAAHKIGKNSLFGNEMMRRELIRSFILQAIELKFPRLGEKDYLLIKEPNGSIGAPLMVEALPESRMIFLVRDPRDVISSNISGHAEGGWFRRQWEKGMRKHKPPPENPDVLVREKARKYREFVSRSKQAYEEHEGPKVLVRYEDLRPDTLGEMKRIYSTLGIKVEEKRLLHVVEKHSWDIIPAKEKGEGKFTRKATPGGWQEDLTSEQVRVVEEITAPLLEEFYRDRIREARL